MLPQQVQVYWSASCKKVVRIELRFDASRYAHYDIVYDTIAKNELYKPGPPTTIRLEI